MINTNLSLVKQSSMNLASESMNIAFKNGTLLNLLPLDLWRDIFKKHFKPNDAYNVCLTSKTLYKLLHPELIEFSLRPFFISVYGACTQAEKTDNNLFLQTYNKTKKNLNPINDQGKPKIVAVQKSIECDDLYRSIKIPTSKWQVIRRYQFYSGISYRPLYDTYAARIKKPLEDLQKTALELINEHANPQLSSLEGLNNVTHIDMPSLERLRDVCVRLITIDLQQQMLALNYLGVESYNSFLGTLSLLERVVFKIVSWFHSFLAFYFPGFFAPAFDPFSVAPAYTNPSSSTFKRKARVDFGETDLFKKELNGPVKIIAYRDTASDSIHPLNRYTHFSILDKENQQLGSIRIHMDGHMLGASFCNISKSFSYHTITLVLSKVAMEIFNHQQQLTLLTFSQQPNAGSALIENKFVNTAGSIFQLLKSNPPAEWQQEIKENPILGKKEKSLPPSDYYPEHYPAIYQLENLPKSSS